jgi:hypothetical protein
VLAVQRPGVAPVPAPTAATRVVVAAEGITKAERERRAVAFDRNQSFSGVARVRARVTRLVIDERWAPHDAAALHLAIGDPQVDAALRRATRDGAGLTRSCWALGVRDAYGTPERRAARRLRRAIARSSPAINDRVDVAWDAQTVFVTGSRRDQIAVARIAHRMAIGRPVPVVLD